MIRFRALGVEMRLHILVILTLGLALALGVTGELAALMVALCVHELSHLIAARACGLEIDYIELMPFGGAAHIVDLYDAPPLRMAIVALAGPLANLLLAVIGAALGWWGALGFPDAARVVRVNVILMLFNLLPALPLDGGRVLCAVAGRFLGRRRAMSLAVGLAHALAAGLLALAVAAFVQTGVVNLSLILMSVFLIASSLAERHAALQADASGAVAKLCAPKKLPARAKIVAIDADAPPAAAARHMRRGEVTLFAVYAGGQFTGLSDESAVAKRILSEKA